MGHQVGGYHKRDLALGPLPPLGLACLAREGHLLQLASSQPLAQSRTPSHSGFTFPMQALLEHLKVEGLQGTPGGRGRGEALACLATPYARGPTETEGKWG